MGMDGQFVFPVLDQALLRDDDDRIDDVLAQPVQHEVNADLGLSQALFVKYGGVGEVFDGLERLDWYTKP